VSAPGWDGGPYTGPPQYGAPQYGPPPQQPWGPPPSYGAPGYPPPGWGGYAPQPPPRPQRPGTVIAAAVFGFVCAVLVLVGTVYAAAFGALLSLARGPGNGFDVWLSLVQVALVGLLAVGGLRVLARDRRWLLGAVAGQLALCVWWFVALADLAPATFEGSLLVLPALYAVLAVVAGGLSLLPDARAWTARAAPPGAGG
jgi:hypothetical protein